jgi:hypothetical protein
VEGTLSQKRIVLPAPTYYQIIYVLSAESRSRYIDVFRRHHWARQKDKQNWKLDAASFHGTGADHAVDLEAVRSLSPVLLNNLPYERFHVFVCAKKVLRKPKRHSVENP